MGGEPATRPRLFPAAATRSHPQSQHLHTCQGLITGLSARAAHAISRFQSHFSDYSAPGRRGAAPAHTPGHAEPPARLRAAPGSSPRVGLPQGRNQTATHRSTDLVSSRAPGPGKETCPPWAHLRHPSPRRALNTAGRRPIPPGLRPRPRGGARGVLGPQLPVISVEKKRKFVRRTGGGGPRRSLGAGVPPSGARPRPDRTPAARALPAAQRQPPSRASASPAIARDQLVFK